MVNMIIDGKQISAEENITIMEAAERNGIPIPKLCYLKGINEIAACRVCVVELEGKEKLITSCNNVVKDGLSEKRELPVTAGCLRPEYLGHSVQAGTGIPAVG